MNTVNLTADEIINTSRPEKIFSEDLVAAKKEYRSLLDIWHPDKNKDPKANDVSSKLNLLYAQAIELLNSGKWMGDTFKFKDSTGVEHAYKYQRHHSFELGSMFFGENIGFGIDSEYGDLCQNAFRVISRLRFDDAEMRKQFAPQMPVDFMFYDRNVVCPNLNKDILLKDLIEYHDIPPCLLYTSDAADE